MSLRWSATTRLWWRLIVAGTACAVLSGCGWWQFGFDGARTGSNPFEVTLNAANVTSLRQVWQVGDMPPRTQPVVVGNTVVTMTSKCPGGFNCGYGIAAFAAGTGAPVWSISPDDLYAEFGLATDGVRVFVLRRVSTPSFAHWVVDARRVSDGALLWTSTDGVGANGPLTVAGGAVFAPGGISLQVLDATTGTTRWSLIANQVKGVAVSGQTAYVEGDFFGQLVALDARTGRQQWATSASLATGSPVVAGGRLFAKSSDGITQLALDASSGSVSWTNASAKSIGAGMPIVDGSRMYAASYFGLVAHSTTTGLPLWIWDQPPNGGVRIAAQPAEANGVVYVPTEEGSGPRLRAIEAATGTSLTAVAFASNATSIGSPVVCNGRVFVVVERTLHVLST